MLTEALRTSTLPVDAGSSKKENAHQDKWEVSIALPSHDQNLYSNSRSEEVLNFITSQRHDKDAGFATFAATARSSGKVLGHIHCQRWKGPVPLVVKEEAFKLGSVWGLQADSRDVAMSLITKSLEHLREIGCKCALAMTQTQNRDWFEGSSFAPGNLLTLDLAAYVTSVDNIEGVAIQTEDVSGDEVTVRHWERMWLECGVPKKMISPNFEKLTLDFIEHARSELGYINVVARSNHDGGVVGSASCQVWNGVVPNVCDNKIGTVWAVYVKPSYRRRGVARALMQRVVLHWKSLGCKHGILLHASDDGRRVYSKLGFRPNNCVVASLVTPMAKGKCEELRTPPEATIDSPSEEMVSELQSIDKLSNLSGTDVELLLRSLPTQLEAVFGSSKEGKSLIEAVQSVQGRHGVLNLLTEENNWLVKNSAKMGRGFDMKKLASDPTKLAEKFDRLAAKYDQWHVGNRSRVEDWVARMARAELPKGVSSKDTVVLDVACGIGLQAGVLRLGGFKGKIIGIDISKGMIARAKDRKIYDSAHAIDIHDGLSTLIGDHKVDLVICTGAMELLDRAKVLSEFARILKPGGHLWMSLQWDGCLDENGIPLPNPTGHQNIFGVKRHEAMQELDSAGFVIGKGCVEECSCAFRTPSPAGDGSFLPVPYLFIVAKRKLL